ncbi:uncharacterized protein LOC131328349 [Rhododendron vialii]|uniref:uncharacterized protein LOC131328349 n=1 Tax=Rhododendron vialii TaxID=182163 RepID=UPI00265F6BCF|nr:uncharacterized protein LOC131328349 [Rhododendron vialii]
MLNYLDKNRTAIIYLEHIGGLTYLDSAAQETDPNMQSNFDLGSFNFDPKSGLEYIYFDAGNVQIGFGNVEFDFGIANVNVDDIGFLDLNFKPDVDGGQKDFAGHVVITDEEEYSDSSSDDVVYYSDHSYQEEDDDGLYETFVDENEKFVGVRVTTEEEVAFDGNGDEIVLSDDDSKYGFESSYYTSSDEENSLRRKHHFKNFRPETDMEDPQFKMGMLFSTPQEFKAAVKQHAIKHQRQVKMVKNDKRRIKAKCFGGTDPEKPCPWEVYAAKVMTESTYQVRTYKAIHKCGKTYSNRNVTSTVIAKKYMDDLRINPGMPIAALKERVRKELKVDVSRNQLYKAKRKAGKLIYGNDIEQYGKLWDYCEELRRTNPGSTVVMDASLDEVTGQPRFNRLYIFLAAVKSGYLAGCRKIIGVDGCHLKGEYSSQLLTVVGVDPNNAMYPMAWCVVENENKDTWTWFLTLMKMDLNITEANEHEWTFINDRQKGLLPAINENIVRSEQRYCAKHILSNFQKQFKGLSLENKFWECAKASHVAQFHDAMEKMKEEDPAAYQWLAKIPASHWNRSHFKEIVKCDMVCNNLCETFNRAILDARDKLIIEMLEWIRCYLSKRMVIRREWIKKFKEELLPNCYSKLEALKD